MMASKHLKGDCNYAWPGAEIAVMGAKVRERGGGEMGEWEEIGKREGREREARGAR